MSTSATTAAPRTAKAGSKVAARKSGAPSGVLATGDPIVDALNAYGFTYTREVIDLSKVDRKQSRLNQARIDAPINEDQVLLYGEGMEAGDKFPPIVVHKVKDGYIVMDGNHRVAAADVARINDAPITTMDAYVVVNASPAQITAFTYEANSKHGLPTSMQDRLRQAIYLIERGVKKSDAAASLKIPTERLTYALDNYNAERRFAKLGNRKLEALTPTHKRVLDSIRSDDVLRPAALLVVESGIGGADLSNFVKRINEHRTEREQHRVIAAERDARTASIKATAGGRIPVPMQLQTLARATSTSLNLDIEKVLQALSDVPVEARGEYARQAGEAGSRLIELGMLIRRASQGE